MSDLLRNASAWFEGVRHAHLTREVEYRRGDTGVATVLATLGRSSFPVVSAAGVLEEVERRDYLVRAADLILGGAQTEPQAGDRIVETVAGREETYEVAGAGQEKAFRRSDGDGLTLRIHTVLVERKDA
jgi:hypothetical protein